METVKRLRPHGERCATSVAMSQVLTESLSPPTSDRRQAERLAAGMLDLRLPLPVERCAVTWMRTNSPGGGTNISLLAFAVPRDVVAQNLAEQADSLLDTESIIPAGLALWSRFVRLHAPADGTVQMQLNTGGRHWSLLVGRGDALQSCLTLEAGDIAAVGRNCQVFCHRWNLSECHLLLCGAAANNGLVQQLTALPDLSSASVRCADDARTFLASALAETAAGDKSASGNLRDGEQTHPAALRRRKHREKLASAVLIISGLSLIFSYGLVLRHDRHLLDEADAALSRTTQRLAGGSLPASGAAAVELARRELEVRLNPEVEAFGDVSMMSELPRLLSAAALRGITFSSLNAGDSRIEFVGEASTEADVAAWRATIDPARLVLAIEAEYTSGGAMRLGGTLMRRGVASP